MEWLNTSLHGPGPRNDLIHISDVWPADQVCELDHDMARAHIVMPGLHISDAWPSYQ